MGVAAVSKKVTDTIMELIQDVYLIVLPHNIPTWVKLLLSAFLMKKERERMVK